MTIDKKTDGSKLELVLSGRLDTSTAPLLEEVVKSEIEGKDELVFEIGGLEYISSAGLRVLLSAQKSMNKQGKMIVKNVSEEIMGIFEVTGFSDILTLE